MLRLSQACGRWQGATRLSAAMIAALAALLSLAALPARAAEKKARPQELRFEISFAREASAAPLDGRVFLLISTDNKAEPRFQISDQATTQQFFGVDVEALAPESPAVFDAQVLGYPLDSLRQIPAGDRKSVV